MEEELDGLFAFRDNSNGLREPWALAESYSCGYVQILRAEYNDFIENQAIIEGNRIVYFTTGADGVRSVSKWIAAEMGSIRNVCRLFIDAVRADTHSGLASSFSPFASIDWCRVDKASTASLMLGLIEFAWYMPESPQRFLDVSC